MICILGQRYVHKYIRTQMNTNHMLVFCLAGQHADVREPDHDDSEIQNA